MMNIKVISNEVIKPSRPTPKSLQFLRASLIDHVNSPTLMPLIAFFPSHNGTTKLSTQEVLDRLKGSLPHTLSLFYPLAGRLQDANHFDCNDEGVPYVLAAVDNAIGEVIHKAEVSHLDKLVPSYGNEGFTTLLLAIQVNVFSCGGLAIGLKMNHSISDAFSYFSFFNTWTYMAKDDRNKAIMCPSFEISKLFPPVSQNDLIGTQSRHVYANHNTDLIKHRPLAKWFAFDAAKLNALRSKLLTSCTNNNDDENCRKISKTSLAMVLSAFIWSRFKVACYGSANGIPHQAYQAVNIRPRLSLSLAGYEQTYYFGNAVVNAIAKLPMKHTISNHSNESIMFDYLIEMKKSIAQVTNNQFIKKMCEGKEDLRFVMDHLEKEAKGEIVSIGFSNLMSMPVVYEADFGWGKPAWVTTASLMFKNVVILLPATASTKDIVAYLNLSPQDMAKLENDKEFTSFVSKLSYVNSKL